MTMSPILLERFDKPIARGIVADVLVAFCSTADLDARALATEVEEEIVRALVPDELVVLVRATAMDAAHTELTTSTQGQALLRRLSGRCRVRMVGYDEFGREVPPRPVADGPLEISRMGLEEILRRGVNSIFTRRNGFVEASPSYHFANPSGAHTDRFIRLSNILARQAEIALMAVAVMRRLPKDARTAYVDTPALYAVTAAINEQWRTLASSGRSLSTENFSSYFGLDGTRFDDLARSVAIISASSSESLGRELVARKSFDPGRIVHVLYLGPDPPGPGVAVDLGFDPVHNPGGFSTERRTFQARDCALCRDGSVPIRLRGDQFDISGPQHPPLTITRNDAPGTLSSTMDRLAGADALRVTAGRRQFHVDPTKLIDLPDFAARLDYLIASVVPAGISMVVRVDEEAATLIDRIVEAVPGLPAPVDAARLPQSRAEPAAGSVLVVASVVGSGRRLLDVSRDLRDVAPGAPIVYLVGFAKVSDPVRKRTLDRSLSQTEKTVPHAVRNVYDMLLPPNQDDNPWRDESDFLKRNRPAWTVGTTRFLEDRLKVLMPDSTPLPDPIFLPGPDGAPLPAA